MKRQNILSVFFMLAMFAGAICINSVSAQKSAGKVASSGESSPGAAAAASLFVDNFNYTAGTLLSANGWSVHSGTTNFLTVTSPGLTLAGYPGSGIGNAVTMTTTGEDANKPFASQTSGTVYAAFMVNVSAGTTTGDYFFHLCESPISGNIFRGRVFAKTDASNNVFIGISKAATSASPANIGYTATGFAFGTTHLVVVKYTIVAGATNDTVDLFIDPNLAGPEPAASASAPDITAADPLNLSLVAIRQGTAANAPTLQIDGIRVARTFADLSSAPKNTSLDFDGDGRTDYAITRNAGGLKTWWVATNGSSTTRATQWGLEFDKLAPADYDGDGKTDIAVWREGTQPGGGGDANKAYFYILQSSTGTVKLEQFGRNGDRPSIVGDYDGDGKADVAVFRDSGTVVEPCGVGKSVFYYRPSGTPATNFTSVCWGTAGDIPTGGDFDGDGKFDFCVRRNAGGSGVFYLRRSGDSGTESFYWGLTTDAIAPGDYDGDGKSDFGVARMNAGNGEFYILERDGGGTGVIPFVIFGINNNDFLAPGDYDGDGRTDIGVFRGNADPAMNFFVVRNSSTGIFSFFEWGQLGDEPAGEWYVTGGG